MPKLMHEGQAYAATSKLKKLARSVPLSLGGQAGAVEMDGFAASDGAERFEVSPSMLREHIWG